MVGEYASNSLVTAAEGLADCLHVGHDAFLLPRMQAAGPPHAAHNFIKNQKGTILIADSLDSLEISGHSWYASERLHRVLQSAVSSQQPAFAVRT